MGWQYCRRPERSEYPTEKEMETGNLCSSHRRNTSCRTGQRLTRKKKRTGLPGAKMDRPATAEQGGEKYYPDTGTERHHLPADAQQQPVHPAHTPRCTVL